MTSDCFALDLGFLSFKAWGEGEILTRRRENYRGREWAASNRIQNKVFKDHATSHPASRFSDHKGKRPGSPVMRLCPIYILGQQP